MDKIKQMKIEGEIKHKFSKSNSFLVTFQLMGIVKYHIIIF